MKLVAPNHLSLSRKLQIGRGLNVAGPRIGGHPPVGTDGELPESARYLGTFPLAKDPILYFSLFTNCTVYEFIDSMNGGFFSDDRVILIMHEDRPRSSSSRNHSKLTAHPLLIGPAQCDWFMSGDRLEPESWHKIGGRPYCLQEPELPGASELYDRGYIQVLQIDIPPSESRLRGDWPFGNVFFNLFWKSPFSNVPYYWYYQG